MAMTDEYTKQRKSIRFQPDPNTLVYIKRLRNTDKEEIDCVGLVSNEAGKGFGCIALMKNSPEKGEECVVKVGDLSTLTARVVYVSPLDEESVKLGFEYME